MKINWDRKEPITVDDVVVLKECIGCLNANTCSQELRQGEMHCMFLHGLYTEGEGFREKFEKELMEDCNG